MDEYVGADYFSERAHVLIAMAVNLEQVTNKEARKLVLQMMEKVVSSVAVTPDKEDFKVIQFPKGDE